MGLEQILDPPFDKRLLVRAAVVLLLAVLELLAFLFPVELKIDIPSGDGDRVRLVDQLDDGLRDVTLRIVISGNSVQFGVEMEVLRHNLERHLHQAFDIVGGERCLVLSPGFHQLDCDGVVVVLLVAFIGVGLRSCSYFTCNTHF